RAQRRGGRGVSGMGTREDDFVQHLFVTNSHNYLLFFSNKSKVYRMKAYEVPELSRTSWGTPIINLIQINQGEYIEAVIPVKEFTPDHYLFFGTRYGVVKKTSLEEFGHIRRNGLFAINLRDGDELVGVRLTDGKQEIILGTRRGMSIRFPEQDVRQMGRTATGVKGIALGDEDEVVGMEVVQPDQEVVIVTSKGYGKRTPLAEYRTQSRGGKGIKAQNVTKAKGQVVGLKVVTPEEDLMIVTTSGVVIRMNVEGISSMSRYAQGVKLISVKKQEEVATLARVDTEEEEN